MDKNPDEKGVEKGFVNQSWSIIKQERDSDSDKQIDCSQSARGKRIPPLKLVRSQSTTKNNENTKLEDCHQKLDKAITAYSMAKQDIIAKHNLPLPPSPERKMNAYRRTDDVENKISSLKVSLKPKSRILASLRNQSVGTNTTMTITEEKEQILDLVESKGLTQEDIRKIKQIKDDDNNKNVTTNLPENKTEYSNMEREHFEKIREALLQSKGVDKKDLLPFLYYLSLDNHDCVKSLLCWSEMNEDVSQPPASSGGCIFKALMDTMMPDTLRKVRKLLRDHILCTADVYDRPAAEQRQSKANEPPADPRFDRCPMAKKVKYSQPSQTSSRITVKNEVQSGTAAATYTRPARPRVPATGPVVGPTNGVALGQAMAGNQMNRHKMPPSLGYPQNNETLPRFWVQPPGMYSAQSTGVPQPGDYGRGSDTRRVVSFPSTQWNTSQQYWN
ncbi:hypothetical protein EVAR_99737_1 [Eumeta japonica]|uniref:Uncharacterized protein n=1 Tax=Eumeta variegata TaxID=151549 RepID=A0A4C1Z2X9_EUMVA|nr:hypothetical protein EVAR_99737_1 [Eumeta japonica]